MAAKKNFAGQSQQSIEEAIQDAIQKDPKGDQGTDIYHYDVVKINVVFGGFAATTTFNVTLKR